MVAVGTEENFRLGFFYFFYFLGCVLGEPGEGRRTVEECATCLAVAKGENESAFNGLV